MFALAGRSSMTSEKHSSVPQTSWRRQYVLNNKTDNWAFFSLYLPWTVLHFLSLHRPLLVFAQLHLSNRSNYLCSAGEPRGQSVQHCHGLYEALVGLTLLQVLPLWWSHLQETQQNLVTTLTGKIKCTSMSLLYLGFHSDKINIYCGTLPGNIK